MMIDKINNCHSHIKIKGECINIERKVNDDRNVFRHRSSSARI